MGISNHNTTDQERAIEQLNECTKNTLMAGGGALTTIYLIGQEALATYKGELFPMTSKGAMLAFAGIATMKYWHKGEENRRAYEELKGIERTPVVVDPTPH